MGNKGENTSLLRDQGKFMSPPSLSLCTFNIYMYQDINQESAGDNMECT